MNLAVNRPRRSVIIASCLVILAATVTISADHAGAVVPAPTNFSISLTADTGTGDCVGALSWQEGRGQIYVQMILFRDVGGIMHYQSSFAGKVSTSGDPRGSKALTYTFPSTGAGDYQLDVTISTAKGKGGAYGRLDWICLDAGNERYRQLRVRVVTAQLVGVAPSSTRESQVVRPGSGPKRCLSSNLDDGLTHLDIVAAPKFGWRGDASTIHVCPVGAAQIVKHHRVLLGHQPHVEIRSVGVVKDEICLVGPPKHGHVRDLDFEALLTIGSDKEDPPPLTASTTHRDTQV